MQTDKPPAVYAAIAAVMRDMGAEGIAKDRKNQQQGYAFRGIDDVYNALSSVLARHGLVMLPTVETRECVERQTKSGGALFYTTCRVRFDLVAASDGSSHSITTYGEAMDSADKSTNKAMSAAYKYAAMQAFCIPTEGDNDADAHTPEVKPQRQPAQRKPDGTVDHAAQLDARRKVMDERLKAAGVRDKVTRPIDQWDHKFMDSLKSRLEAVTSPREPGDDSEAIAAERGGVA